MKRAIALLLTLSLMMVSLASVSAQSGLSQAPVDPIEGCEYYEATGHNVCEPFQSYWEANGGLPIFGYPITEAFEEVSLDTGGTYLVQYFERERLEHHPALAGTEYEILLGRLGNEVLLQQGRNWMEFPKSSPSEPNYFAETGFAVPQVFMDYWRSYGLDLGDPGISFRESLALFGYPISQAQMETNMAGDTVLTQWFERARFEHHPENGAEHQVLLGLLGSELLAGEEPPPPPPPPAPEVNLTLITDDVLQPRHINVGADGALYVANAGMGGDNCVVIEMPEEAMGQSMLAQNGDEEEALCFGNSGSITRIANGVAETVVSGLPSLLFGQEALGVHSVVVTGDGDMYAVMGWGFGFTPELRASFGEAAMYFGWLVKVEADGSLTPIADLLQYEADVNPESTAIDSNPYSMTMDGDTFLVVDAGGNSLVRVTMDGEVSLVAIFPAQMTPAPPFLGLPEGTQIPMESVPTDVVVGPDGAYYVSELTGFPFTAGAARIWRVQADGTAEVYATGFTNIGAIDFDSEGNLIVMEMVSGGLLQADPGNPITAAGAVIKVHADGTRETLVSGANGLIFPTGMALNGNDRIYLANFGVIPGLSQIVRVDPIGPVDPEPEQVLTTVAEGLDFPLHASAGPDGAVYVAEAGTAEDECVVVEEDPETGEVYEACFGLGGAITRIDASGATQVVTGLPNPSDVHVTEDGDMYVVFGLGGPPEFRDLFEHEAAAALGHLAQVHEDGSWTLIADLAQFEADVNPDPTMIDSNPYSLTMDGDDFLVVDAGGNTLLHVTMDGEISLVAVFEAQMVDAPPFLGLPEGTQMPMESVPTDVVVGPDGNYYVAELTGFPFEVGAARVFQVTPDGDVSVFADGFSAIGALDFDSEGNLYVLEIATGGLLAAEMASPDEPEAALSRVVRIAPDGTQTDYVTAGIYFATGLAIDNDDRVFIVNMSVTPMASVVRVDWVTPE